MNKKLAVITTHPIQYQAPLWRSLAQAEGIEIHVYFGSDFSITGCNDREFGVHLSWDVPLTEGYPHTFLSSDLEINRPADLTFNIAEFKKKLVEFQPDYALLNAYTPFPFYLKALLTLRLMGIPILLRGETTDVALERSRIKIFFRNLFLKILYRQIDGFLAIGVNSRHHYVSRGKPENRIYFSPYNVDSQMLDKQVEDFGGRRAEIRRELGFDDGQFVFIFSGKLIPKKDPLIIIQALRRQAEKSGVDLGLIVMGDGELRQQFESKMQSLPKVKTIFTGFQNQSRLGFFYTAADCLVLPSRWGETWGLVVNEALQFGMPAIVSDKVGCWRDLVISGATGYVFPAGDAEALAGCMSSSISLIKMHRDSVRKACRQKAREYSAEQAVAGIKQSLGETLS